VIAAALERRFPGVPVIGCSTAGEFTERGSGTGGVCAAALPRQIVRRHGLALADFTGGVEIGFATAVRQLETRLGTPLRDLSPDRHIGLVLIDGLTGAEERVNELLGDAAPLLSFVGGSAGDDLAFAQTRVYTGARSTTAGAALLVLELTVPFAVVKTCSFRPTDRSFVATGVDLTNRIVHELDGRPAAEAYADAVGQPIDRLDSTVFMSHPLGLMIDGRPWIRSPQQVLPDGGIKFYCQILDGMRVQLMVSTPLAADTAAAVQAAAAEVGGRPSGAIMFNCILRRLETDATGSTQQFVDALGGIPTAGFHTYGESWLGHMNQTLTGVVFG
jgi:hypothetical protein